MRQATAVILLSEEEKVTQQDWSRRGKSEHRMVERARIILLAGEGRTNEQIAMSLKTRTARVSKWRQRFGVKRLASLSDAERSGKPAKYDERARRQRHENPARVDPQIETERGARIVHESQANVIADDLVWDVLRRQGGCGDQFGNQVNRNDRYQSPPKDGWIRLAAFHLLRAACIRYNTWRAAARRDARS